MTILTSEGNWHGQSDNCYVILKVGLAELIVDDADG
jgi:hypothetical protein